MADNWQVGDLALCVQGGRICDSPVRPDAYPKAGMIYPVVGVFVEDFFAGVELALILENAPPNADGRPIWAAIRFRKIKPHAPDAEDEETIRLLNSAPCNVPSHVVTPAEKEYERG